MAKAPQSLPSLAALCVARLAMGAPQRALLSILRRLPEELVLTLLADMIASKTLTDDRLAAFFMISRRVLNLSGCCAIRNSILRQIPFRCPELRCLDLSNCPQVTNTVIRAVLQGCSNLQTLQLDGCRHITDAAFQPDHSPFYALHACTSLKVAFTTEPSDQRNGFYAMGRALRAIDLTQSNITDATLFALAKHCPQLEEVKLSCCSEITDVGIEALVRSCRCLRTLDLNNCALVTDRGVAGLASPRGNYYFEAPDCIMSWRRFDLNVKGVEGIQERTIGGGVVTVVSCVVVAFLLLSEFSVWWTVSVTHRMHVDTDPVQKVAGDLSFAHEGSLTVFSFFDFLNFNSSHVVNHLRFGPQIPDMETPLIDVSKILTKNLATYKYFVSVVPSRYVYLNGRSVTTFQYSVTEHETSSRGPNGQVSFPGVIFSYEFSPIAVEYIESKPSVLHFLTSTSAIVGGVFAVARMIDGAIYSVSKKVD
ncbi:Leucine-rich repeat domain, L domain-like [Phytophthora cactorum]|nr:Leucine-rich repeat domain, L domain-like [Phytophthora cactorum]